MTTTPHPLKAYWQPGCTSCLRMKEFLQKHGVPFVSVNVLEDEKGFEELAALGLRTVPIVARGKDWANGQVLRDVARVAGIRLGEQQMLPPAELMRRLNVVQEAAQRMLRQIPEERLGHMLPNRPRSYAELVFHIFNIAELFVWHEVDGRPLITGDYNAVPPPAMKTRAQLLAYGEDVQRRLNDWWLRQALARDFESPADVYYGEQSVHEYLERTTWHSGQHVRQLTLVLETLGIAPDRPPGPETWQGLPMPAKVWDDEKPFG